MKWKIQLACLLLSAIAGCADESATISGMVDTGKMESMLGEGWKRDRGMVIEKESDVDNLTGVEKETGKMVLQLMKPHGVVACGEFSFSRTDAPANNLTVKVYRFASSAEAETFRRFRYESEESKPLYRKTATDSAVVYDSLEIRKRIFFHDVFWITCGQLQDDDLHLRILEGCVRFGKAAKKPDPSQ